MSNKKNVDGPLSGGESELSDVEKATAPSEVSSVAGNVQSSKTQPRVSSSSDRQIKFERAQKCLEKAALMSKRIKEHRKATAELLGKPFEDDDTGDTASEVAGSTVSGKTGYSVATDTSTTLSVQEALNIPGISESLANTLKQKELLMERIKQYKEISKRPMKTAAITKSPLVDTRTDPKDTSHVTQLMNTIKEKENVLSVMQVKLKAMETTVLDLQEKINEKDQIIEAKNRATTLMSDSLSKKEKDSLSLLEDTKQQMTKMQENFINMELEWKEEKNRLLIEIEEKNDKIAYLEEANTILENSRFEISLAHAKLAEELELKDKEILNLQEKIQNLYQAETKKEQELTEKEKEDIEEEKGSKEITDMVELTRKIELLEQLNCQIRQTNKELENKLLTMSTESKATPSSSPIKKSSPLPTRKGGRNTAKKSPWTQLSSESTPQEVEKKPNKTEVNKLEMIVQSLNKEILDKEYLISQQDVLISELKTAIQSSEFKVNELKSQIRHETELVDVGICTETFTDWEPKQEAIEIESGVGDLKDLNEKLKAAENQIVALNNEIEAANRNMIKVKSGHKLKLKQMQKTIDNFCKVSDANSEIVKLNEELHQLSQKVAELEEEKGNLQLHLVDYDSGRLTESDIYKKMVEMENLSEVRLKSISVLEAQKFELVQELHDLQQKNAEMEDKIVDMSQFYSEQVSSEIKSVQLEEQIDELNKTIKKLEQTVENFKFDKAHLEVSVKMLHEEKEEMVQKLESYIQENIELTDKLEKLSAEKVSSAESIEIVESLTTQEKLELEEYNKRFPDNKTDCGEGPVTPECKENIAKLVEQSAELSRKIELFTQERQEVMDKMNIINTENETLHQKMLELNSQCIKLQSNIEMLTNEKLELNTLNDELNRQIEELKHERLDIMKESVEMVKAPAGEELTEGITSETQTDDKVAGEKGNNRTKSVKQLTKEILKFKNIIKEREAEIGDCQMKILSLEEQQQKYNELSKSTSTYENKIKVLTDENQQLKVELENVKKDKLHEQSQLSQEILQQEVRKLHNDYAVSINSRDARIQELETLLIEYENQIFNYGNTLQQKDKELTEYINQITKLNDVSQKLKSTIDLLEEEKANDPNAELVKTLNKQILGSQKKLAECEEKLRKLEEERVQILNVKGVLENKITNLDAELKQMQEIVGEKQNLIKELQAQKQKHTEEMLDVLSKLKERDEEVHEIKLQLRKESIENEKLRTALSEKEKNLEELTHSFKESKEIQQKFDTEKVELNEKCQIAETKNRELLEKLKKFAATVKKKFAMYIELEAHLNETQKRLEDRTLQVEQLLIQVDTLPALQEKLKYAEDELNRLQSQKSSFVQQKFQDVIVLQSEINSLQDRLTASSQESKQMIDALNVAQKELHHALEENRFLNNKIADLEVEQKNNINYVTKISSLESDIKQKEIHIAELMSKVENLEQQLSQAEFGQGAKMQERDLYIESLETEINKYKNRICRLEESICEMEGRRNTLERKADQLGSQLEEKQKAYSEFTSQEDQLVSRLAVLMDHDRVLEKQLHEIDNENKELLYKLQHLSEENQHIRKALSDIQNHCNILEEKASRTDCAESELAKHQSQVHKLDAELKRITNEYQILIVDKKREIEEIESEFNIQIENAIREKKVLSEKYEKMNERVAQLDAKLQEFKNINETLNINIEDLNKINNELVQKSSKNQEPTPDYTEQYINEINRLNSFLNSKNQELNDLQNKLQNVQNNQIGIVSNLESVIAGLTEKLQLATKNAEEMFQEINILKADNEQLHASLCERDEQIRLLTEEKCVKFEMTIPKTEGMIIASTIEPLHDEKKKFDVSTLESQILSESEVISVGKQHKKPEKSEKMQEITQSAVDSGEFLEPKIVSKKAYLCYQGDDTPDQPDDPFNSDEGWGLGEGEEIGEVTPGLTHLTDQITRLQQQNAKLMTDIESSNNKLVKVMKKFKEMKASNEMLSNELRISKQISQSSCLDSAIEDELKDTIGELEKKLEELTADLNKEKREKDSLRKQNEVFHSANERLTEMKEKLDNEIELWKFKFKEANDKIATLQWDDSKDSPAHKSTKTGSISKDHDHDFQEELLTLEKENDELQSMIDQLTTQNKELSKKMQEYQTISENFNTVNSKILELKTGNDEWRDKYDELKKNMGDLENKYKCLSEEHTVAKQKLDESSNKIEELKEIQTLTEKCEVLSNKLIELKKINKDLNENNSKLESDLKESNDKRMSLNAIYEEIKLNSLEISQKLENEISSLKDIKHQYENKISGLTVELEEVKLKLLWIEQEKNANQQNVNPFELSEQYSAVQGYSLQLQHDLQVANSKILELESENQNLLQKIRDYELQAVGRLSRGKLEQFSSENNEFDLNKENIGNTQSSLQSVFGDQESLQKTTGSEQTILELSQKIRHLNAENDQLLSTVAELRSSISSAVDQRGFEIAELWKQHLAQREADFQKTEQELRAELNASEAKYEQLLDTVQSSSQEETNKMVMMEQFTSLQNKLHDKEEHLRDLQDKYAEVMNQIDVIRSEMEDEKIIYETKLAAQQEEYDSQIKELSQKNKEYSQNYDSVYNNLQSEISAMKAQNAELIQQLEETHKKVEEYEKQVLDLTNQLRIKDAEIFQKTHDFTISLTQRNEEFENVRKQLLEYEKKIEELTYEKESELAVLRLKLHEHVEDYQRAHQDTEEEKLSLVQELNGKILECTSLNKKISDLNRDLEEKSKEILEMQTALESQELEIVTLKDEISNLQELLKSSASKIEKHVTFASDTKPGADVQEISQEDATRELLDPVPRAELDLALYMLHQRDVRCEELTMELTQLLDERDTLQLRLSDSLRSYEELKARCQTPGTEFNLSQESIPEPATLSVEREQPLVDVHKGQTSRNSSISDVDGDKPKLQAKLSELRSVKQSRDVRLRHDSEQRQLDLRLLQRDVANLPPEAREQLAQAHHTLSRDSQSTSTVLLNWLRGKSTPKVVHM